MQREPIKITWDELSSEKVTSRVERLDAMLKARNHYDNSSVAVRPTPPGRFAFLYNTIVYMSFFGLVGGALGFGLGSMMKLFLPNQRLAAQEIIDAYTQIEQRTDLSTADKAGGLKALQQAGRSNEYVRIFLDPKLSLDQKTAKHDALANHDHWKELIADVLFFGLSGMMIAMLLSAGEALVSRNWQGAAVDASVGAALGLIGGIVLALAHQPIYNFITGQIDVGMNFDMEILAQSATWGILGLFLAAAPGITLKNTKRLAVGMVGGLIGGLVGGAMIEPIRRQFAADDLTGELLGRAAAMLAIGLLTGAGTGLLESVIKSGWIRVTRGLIAGKQFVLYRNPTYIGSAPNCHVYLFRDPAVGRRHAAIHVVPGGFDLEDLPLGDTTKLNGKPIKRARLQNNDVIEIGSTAFTFNERVRT